MPFSQLHILHLLWLPVASFFAGVLNTIAGGGSFLSLPALIGSTSALGIGAVTAQATNTVALWPGQLTSLVAFRQLLRQYGWKLLPLSVASGVGGFIGGRLLLMTGNALFRTLLPWLLLFAAVMFVLSFPLGRWLQTLSGGERYNKWLLFGMVIVSVYVGYFGAGGGFLVMALFGLCGVHDIHEMNALKVITAAVSIGIPAISFILAGRVQWHFCLEMAILAAIGGYLGAHYSRKVNQRAMRWTVAAIGFLTAGYFFMQNYMLRHG
ncbi:MAG TPA: sulfite exporter TauE/SafE family protein [Terracidiphilus sp.]